jgi:heat-inducible transcriptional repressor
MASALEERNRDVLRAVVEEFISIGEPVGSAQLTRRGDFEVSAATMRNVLAELEELGYLEKPHTSAGRIPTDAGFRFFVDSLLHLSVPPIREREFIAQGIAQSASVEERFVDASRVLHQLSKHAAVVLMPSPASVKLSRIDFVRLKEQRLVAILMGAEGQVHNKLIELDFSLSGDELVHAARYLNDMLGLGVAIDEVRGRILSAMETERTQYDQLAQKALLLGAAATDVSSAERILIEGQASFLEAKEFADDVERMRTLFKAFDEKQKLLQLLDRIQRAKEMQIYIGAESEFSAQGEVSVIATPISSGESIFGTVGVIGPTRMDYQRMIPLVKFTAHAIATALKQGR